MKKRFNCLFVIMVMALVSVNPACYINDKDISGIWDVYWQEEVDTYEYFTFKQSGDFITGTFYDEDEGFINVSGTITDNTIDVDVLYSIPDVEKFHLDAVVSKDGKSMDGTITVKVTGADEEVITVQMVKRKK
jgi:hypothetical protein